ncbi:hypothetical protein [Microbacterium sp. P03]|uniref:hypothetical protein n=1 Tax=Microbacterium sp. P03 TaxID=3366946 RepID=UPI003746DB2F
MSYDVRVYGRTSLSREGIDELLHLGSLTVDDAPGGDVITVLRGVRRQYSFSFEGPVDLDPDDVPEHIVALILEPHYLYRLSVEGSSATEIPHALRFAARLAHAVGGVVEDPQAALSRRGARLREVHPVAHGTSTNVLVMTWYAPAISGRDTARMWLGCARRDLPEALPRRFGVFEPLQHKLAIDGDEAFITLAESADPFITLRCTQPCLNGVISNNRQNKRFVVHTLTVLMEPLEHPGWRTAVRRFFTRFAAASSAVFASAEVQTGMRWNGRTLSYTPDSDFVAYLAPSGDLMGLPPYPVSWAWLGQDYLDNLDTSLPPVPTEAHTRGTLLIFADCPVAREDLPAGAQFADHLRAQYAQPLRRGASVQLVPATDVATWS